LCVFSFSRVFFFINFFFLFTCFFEYSVWYGDFVFLLLPYVLYFSSLEK